MEWQRNAPKNNMEASYTTFVHACFDLNAREWDFIAFDDKDDTLIAEALSSKQEIVQDTQNVSLYEAGMDRTPNGNVNDTNGIHSVFDLKHAAIVSKYDFFFQKHFNWDFVDFSNEKNNKEMKSLWAFSVDPILHNVHKSRDFLTQSLALTTKTRRPTMCRRNRDSTFLPG